MKATNEKAKELLEYLLSIDPHPIAYLWACWHDRENNSEQKVKDLMDLAVKALEKQIPKKPYWLGEGCLKEAVCEDCRGKLFSYYDYCPVCGQKINWED